MSKQSKELVECAQKELEEEKREKQVKLIKEVIKRTLEKIEELDGEIKERQEEKRIFKQDLDNIKAGRLDLIEERQKKNEKARHTSIIQVERVKEIHHHHYDRWYEPYRIIPVPTPCPTYPQPQIWWTTYETACNGDDIGMPITTSGYLQVDNSLVKDAAEGTYQLSSGTVTYFK